MDAIQDWLLPALRPDLDAAGDPPPLGFGLGAGLGLAPLRSLPPAVALARSILYVIVCPLRGAVDACVWAALQRRILFPSLFPTIIARRDAPADLRAALRYDLVQLTALGITCLSDDGMAEKVSRERAALAIGGRGAEALAPGCGCERAALAIGGRREMPAAAGALAPGSRGGVASAPLAGALAGVSRGGAAMAPGYGCERAAGAPGVSGDRAHLAPGGIGDAASSVAPTHPSSHHPSFAPVLGRSSGMPTGAPNDSFANNSSSHHPSSRHPSFAPMRAAARSLRRMQTQGGEIERLVHVPLARLSARAIAQPHEPSSSGLAEVGARAPLAGISSAHSAHPPQTSFSGDTETGALVFGHYRAGTFALIRAALGVDENEFAAAFRAIEVPFDPSAAGGAPRVYVGGAGPGVQGEGGEEKEEAGGRGGGAEVAGERGCAAEAPPRAGGGAAEEGGGSCDQSAGAGGRGRAGADNSGRSGGNAQGLAEAVGREGGSSGLAEIEAARACDKSAGAGGRGGAGADNNERGGGAADNNGRSGGIAQGLAEVASSGASGSYFYFTPCKRFIVKTITRKEKARRVVMWAGGVGEGGGESRAACVFHAVQAIPWISLYCIVKTITRKEKARRVALRVRVDNLMHSPY